MCQSSAFLVNWNSLFTNPPSLGARAAGLDPDYISRLSQTHVFETSAAVKKIRANRPDPDSLPEITVEELAKHEEWVAVIGYVIHPPDIWFSAHKVILIVISISITMRPTYR